MDLENMTFVPDKTSLWHWPLWPFRVIAALLVLADELARPLYRPLIDWLATRRITARFAKTIRHLPRSVILMLFAVPFAIAEPLKIFALVLIARGLIVTGIALLVLAYLMTFLIVERIYHAGREKLLTYPWFAWAMKQIGLVRAILLSCKNEIVAWARTLFRSPR